MNKPAKESQPNASLPDKVREWLNLNGYPLEMEVANLLRQSSLDVSQSEYYHDSETDTPREIDVVARKRIERFDINLFLTLSFAIECKKSSKPWVAFTQSRRSRPSAQYTGCFFNYFGSLVLQQLLERKACSPLYEFEGKLSYGLTVARFNNSETTNGDAAYKALHSASKAAQSIVTNTKAEVNVINYTKAESAAIALPIIVLDGSLLEAYMDDQGNLEVNEIKQTAVTFGYPLGGQFGEKSTLVRVFTKSAFEDFAKSTRSLGESLDGDDRFFEIAFKNFKAHQPKSEIHST